MKFRFILFALLTFTAATFFTACEKETEVIVDSSLPQGTFTAAKNGTITEQNGTASKGAVQLGTDSKGVQFLRFGTDFSTVLATGTVTVYLSTSQTYTADPANGNPDLRLIGFVSKNGETFYKLDPVAASKFTHVILWCGSAGVPFGYAPLQ